MKITKLLPIALAVTMATSGAAFAAKGATTPTNVETGNLEYTLDLNDYFNIAKTATKNSATTSFDEKYTSITIDGTLDATFEVISNLDTDYVLLYATCPAGGEDSTVEALYGSETAPIIVFARDDGSAILTEANATNLKNDSKFSKNAVAFSLTQGIITKSAFAAEATKAWATSPHKGIKYTISNGKYTIPYTISGSAAGTSFSVDDAQGTYQATLYMMRTTL